MINFLSIFLILFSFSSTNEIDELFIVNDIRNNQKIFYKNDNNLFIFLDSYNCLECLIKIHDNIKMFKINKNINFIIRCNNDVIIQKKFEKSLKEFFNQLDYSIYYDIHIKDDPFPPINLEDGIFSLLSILKTPQIGFYKDSGFVIYNFNELFIDSLINTNFLKN